MRSATLPSFWDRYRKLGQEVRAGAKKVSQDLGDGEFRGRIHKKRKKVTATGADKKDPGQISLQKGKKRLGRRSAKTEGV